MHLYNRSIIYIIPTAFVILTNIMVNKKARLKSKGGKIPFIKFGKQS